MTQKTIIVKDNTSTEPIILREIDAVSIQVTISGVSATLASPTNAFYKRGSDTDLSSTYLSGSTTVSGLDTIITKTTQNLKAGEYIWAVNATVDGQVMNVATILVYVKRNSEP